MAEDLVLGEDELKQRLLSLTQQVIKGVVERFGLIYPFLLSMDDQASPTTFYPWDLNRDATSEALLDLVTAEVLRKLGEEREAMAAWAITTPMESPGSSNLIAIQVDTVADSTMYGMSYEKVGDTWKWEDAGDQITGGYLVDWERRPRQ